MRIKNKAHDSWDFFFVVEEFKLIEWEKDIYKIKKFANFNLTSIGMWVERNNK